MVLIPKAIKPSDFALLFLSLVLLSLVGSTCCQEARAQVTGTFFPTVLGEIQEPGRTPFPQLAPQGLPYGEQQMIQLQNEILLQRRPYLNFVSSYANQSLVGPEFQMDSFTPEICEFGFFPTLQSEVRFSYIPTIFGKAALHSPNVFGQEYRGAFNYQPTNRLKLSGRLGLYQFVQTGQVRGGLNVLGNLFAQYAINDRIHVTAGFRRDILGNSLLSTTGLNLPGTNELVGRDTQNLFFGLLDMRITPRTYLGLTYGGGIETGTRVRTNPFMQAGLSLTRSLYQRDVKDHVSNISFTYQLLELNWKYNLINVGNAGLQVATFPPAQTEQMLHSARLGQTQIPASPGTKQAGVGGYYSPSAFLLNSWGLSATGRMLGPVYYRGGGGVSIGGGTSLTSGLQPGTFGGFANASIAARLNRHMVLENGWIFFQGASLYRRNVLYSQCRYFF